MQHIWNAYYSKQTALPGVVLRISSSYSYVQHFSSLFVSGFRILVKGHPHVKIPNSDQNVSLLCCQMDLNDGNIIT